MKEKVREFWIDPEPCDEDMPNVFDAFSEHPGQGPLMWQSNLIPVIEKAPVMKHIEMLKAENERFKEALRRIAAEDFRGPRPWSASFAYKVLHGDEE